MDVACAKSQQPAFRFLASQIPAFGEHCPDTKRIKPIKSITNYLEWLGSRKVAIRSLLLTGCCVYRLEDLNKSNMRLLSVESIVWQAEFERKHLSSDLVEGVLRVCPNVTHLELGRCVAFSPAIAAHVPKLTSIKLPESASDRKDAKLEALFAAFGPQLLELRMPSGELSEPRYSSELSEPMFQLLCEKCPLLQTLETAVHRFKLHRYARLLQSCKWLSELVLLASCSAELNPNVIADLVNAAPQLKRLSVVCTQPATVTYSVFTAVQEARPGLEHLRIGRWLYTPHEGILHMHLCKDSFDPAMVERVLVGCRNVQELEMFGLTVDVTSAMAETIVTHLQGNLRLLFISADDSRAIELLLCKFGMSLKCLKLDSKGLTNELFRLICVQCPLLETFAFDNTNNSKINATDEGIIDLLTTCSLLKSVSFHRFDMTPAPLHAIIKNRMRLTVLRWSFTGKAMWGVDHVKWFREQVVEHQLLPMPVVLSITY